MALSSKSWNTAILEVARVVNGQDDDDQLEIAAGYISDAIKDWNARRRWKFLLDTASITLTTGVSTFYLPSGFKAPYSAYLVNRQKHLKWLSNREYIDKEIQFLTGDSLYYMSASPSNSLDRLSIVPAPPESDTLKLHYYRRMNSTVGTAETLDIPAEWEGFILSHAKEMMVADKGPTEKLQYWQMVAERGYKTAIDEDEDMPDTGVGFQLDLAALGSY